MKPREGPNPAEARLGPAQGSKRALLPASEAKMTPRSEIEGLWKGLIVRRK
jgi:hypothetical protein